MNNPRWKIGRPVTRAVVATVAATLLVLGAAWRISTDLSAATPRVSTSESFALPGSAAQSAPGIRTSGGRVDSYADIVKVVSPAVVTIHTEGKTTMSPAQFQRRTTISSAGSSANRKISRTARASRGASGKARSVPASSSAPTATSSPTTTSSRARTASASR